MSKFPKSARHPDLATQIDNWRTLQAWINVEDDSQLSDIPGLEAAAQRGETSCEHEQFPQVREIVGASAVRAIAKCCESIDAVKRCDSGGVAVSAMLQAYNASFFAAKGFCMLMGFAPMNRDSAITVDAFPETIPANKREGIFVDVLGLHRYKRWGHEGVWALTTRLVDTVSVPSELSVVKRWLRHAKLSESARARNRFHYDDRWLVRLDDVAYADFPDVVEHSILTEAAPLELAHQFFVAQYLMKICTMVVDAAEIGHLLLKCASRRRLDTASGVSHEAIE